ncbi:MAG TPA: hypothetical protein VK705_11500 [Ferruginibacter sp.]|jgi:hypothetical protein|nr:hypothetical protein [Ferruginibacter sp.]
MKKLVVIVFLFSNYWSIAQVTLQPLLPQVGLFQKSQLWNILAINTSSVPLQCYVVLSLQDRQSGTEIISATSSDFALDKGSKQLNVASLTPIQYTYFSFGGDKMNDFLTVGSYMACFKLIGVGHESGELAEACVPFDVEPLSPPMLIMPADSSVLQVQPTQFTWQPPAPLTMFQQLHYELLIVEILPNQRPEEAIELNAPFFMDLNVTGNIMNYTGAYPSLDQDKWYAWQVVAQDGQSYAAKTQVWDFKVDQNSIPLSIPTEMPYATLKRNLEAGSVVCKADLRIEYDNQINDKTINYKISALGNANNKIAMSGVLKLTSGKNFIDIPLDGSFNTNKTYLFQLTNSRSENWNVKFLKSK